MIRPDKIIFRSENNNPRTKIHLSGSITEGKCKKANFFKGTASRKLKTFRLGLSREPKTNYKLTEHGSGYEQVACHLN